MELPQSVRENMVEELDEYLEAIATPDAEALTRFVVELLEAAADEYGIDTTHEWIQQRTGIEQRHYSDVGVFTSDLAVHASEAAIASSGMDKSEIDMIIFATGFDAVTGALHRIDITGVGGAKLKDKWREGPRTYLGMQIAGFPNLFTPVGPHNGAAFCNIPRCIEQNVEWLRDLFERIERENIERVEAEVDAEDAWTDHVNETAAATLFPTAKSWIMGINENVPDKVTGFVAYAGGFPNYRAKCDEVAEKDYAGFSMR